MNYFGLFSLIRLKISCTVASSVSPFTTIAHISANTSWIYVV